MVRVPKKENFFFFVRNWGGGRVNRGGSVLFSLSHSVGRRAGVLSRVYSQRK